MEVWETLSEALTWLAGVLDIELADVVRTAFRFVTIWSAVWIGLSLMKAGARQIERSVDDGDDSVSTHREKRGRTLAQLLRSVGRALLVSLGLMLTLDLFVDIGPLLAGAGVLGLAVSFGAQSLVKDVISGFFLLLEDQLAVGDVVQINDRLGHVEHMSLRVVQVRSFDGTLHMIPCGNIAMVSNMTRVFSKAIIEIGVAYGAAVDRVIELFKDESARFAADPEFGPRLDGEPLVEGVESLADSAVVIRTILKTKPGLQWMVAREFRRRVKNRLDAEGIEIPFPQRTMWLRVEDPQLAAALTRAKADETP